MPSGCLHKPGMAGKAPAPINPSLQTFRTTSLVGRRDFCLVVAETLLALHPQRFPGIASGHLPVQGAGWARDAALSLPQLTWVLACAVAVIGILCPRNWLHSFVEHPCSTAISAGVAKSMKDHQLQVLQSQVGVILDVIEGPAPSMGVKVGCSFVPPVLEASDPILLIARVR